MSKKIAVIGDLMIDEYLSGKVTRISPEAPVPVVNSDEDIDYRLGGCGNVANNIASLGTTAVVFSVCGNDDAGHNLLAQFKQKGIQFDSAFSLLGYSTITKQRVLGNGQQIVRIDRNDIINLKSEDRHRIITAFTSRIKEFSVVIISDYNKGICDEYLCSSVIRMCNENNIPVIVDPKGKNWAKYKDAYLITPNVKELSDYLGTIVANEDEEIISAVKKCYESLGIKHFLLTRSEKGMTLFTKDSVRNYKSNAREVFDVSGAGDTVVASLAVFLAGEKAGIENAVCYSNIAAGIVVGKRGTATVSLEEIENEIGKDSYGAAPIFNIEELDKACELISIWKNNGYKIVTTNGCFDILHKGHVSLLNQAKSNGDKLIVCINSDESVKRLKGERRPINSDVDRAFLISSLRMVDAVVIFDEKIQGESNTDVPFEVIKRISPDVHVKGGDYKRDQVPEAVYAREFVAVPFIEGYSSTNTISKF